MTINDEKKYMIQLEDSLDDAIQHIVDSVNSRDTYGEIRRAEEETKRAMEKLQRFDEYHDFKPEENYRGHSDLIREAKEKLEAVDHILDKLDKQRSLRKETRIEKSLDKSIQNLQKARDSNSKRKVEKALKELNSNIKKANKYRSKLDIYPRDQAIPFMGNLPKAVSLSSKTNRYLKELERSDKENELSHTLEAAISAAGKLTDRSSLDEIDKAAFDLVFAKNRMEYYLSQEGREGSRPDVMDAASKVLHRLSVIEERAVAGNLEEQTLRVAEDIKYKENPSMVRDDVNDLKEAICLMKRSSRENVNRSDLMQNAFDALKAGNGYVESLSGQIIFTEKEIQELERSSEENVLSHMIEDAISAAGKLTDRSSLAEIDEAAWALVFAKGKMENYLEQKGRDGLRPDVIDAVDKAMQQLSVIEQRVAAGNREEQTDSRETEAAETILDEKTLEKNANQQAREEKEKSRTTEPEMVSDSQQNVSLSIATNNADFALSSITETMDYIVNSNGKINQHSLNSLTESLTEDLNEMEKLSNTLENILNGSIENDEYVSAKTTLVNLRECVYQMYNVIDSLDVYIENERNPVKNEQGEILVPEETDTVIEFMNLVKDIDGRSLSDAHISGFEDEYPIMEDAKDQTKKDIRHQEEEIAV